MRINVTRSSMPDFEEFCQEIRPLWDSHWLTNNGEKLLELQSRLEAYLDVGHLSLFTNGHLALEALLEALDLRGEVITIPFFESKFGIMEDGRLRVLSQHPNFTAAASLCRAL